MFGIAVKTPWDTVLTVQQIDLILRATGVVGALAGSFFSHAIDEVILIGCVLDVHNNFLWIMWIRCKQ